MMASDTSAALIGAITVPGTARAARIVRHYVKEILDPGLPALDDLALCVTELVANAVVHTKSGAGGHVTIKVAETEKEIKVDVNDDGGTRTVPRISRADSGESGRGLRIVDALATAWGVQTNGKGATVWFTVSL